MSTRYIVDAEGRPVEAILDIEEYRAVLEAQRQVAEASEELRRVTRKIAHVASGPDLAEYRRALDAMAEALRGFSDVARAVEAARNLEDLEDLEAIRAYDADMEKLDREEDETVPLRDALPRIEAERAELKRRGEL